MDTIFAQATAQGRAGVSILRISGPQAFEMCESLCGTMPPPRKAVVRNLRDPNGGMIDQAVVIGFPAPNSFTGEDVVELHVHGSFAIMRRLFDIFSLTEGARLAEAGEFSKRALESGKLDLSQIEGLGALIDAETEAQRQLAQKLFSGALGAKVEVWRAQLVRACALIEATIDFADEDVPVDVSDEVRTVLSGLIVELQSHYDGYEAAERIRVGFEVAIIGRPNVGKSTLLNRIAGRDAAITSNIAGTTRDVIEVRTDINGLNVTFLDMAGIRESDDEIEQIGVKAALSRAEGADIRIFLREGHEEPLIPMRQDDLIVEAKADDGDISGLGVSGLTGHGVEDLLSLVSDRLQERANGAGLATHARHRAALSDALVAIRCGLDVLARGVDQYEFCAEELRVGVRCLESLIGRVGVEDYLGEIFSSFCIGK